MSNFKLQIYRFYNKNKNNIIGKTARFIKYNFIALRKSNYAGTKGDLKYIKPGEGVFMHTKRIAIELSNICNYANIHTKCPLHLAKEPKILPEKIVYHILETCQKYNFQGYLTFDVYNEPTIDPRLMMFVRKAKKMLPKAKIILQTNGFYFTQTLADEFEESGVSLIRVSAYSPKEGERLSKIKLKIPIKVTSIILDDRMQMYSLPEIGSCKPCFAPLNELLITHDGHIALCCLEWKREIIFGDLYKQSLEEILLSEEIQNTYKRLSQGDRYLEICKRCESSR
jgi:radical SAM protein with 4Fe4S-binding SPASM domain